MNKQKKRTLVFIIILIIILLGLIGLKFYLQDNKEQIIKVVKTNKEYGYVLEDRDTKLYKTEYEKLNQLLKEKPVDEQKYTEAIAKLFIIDLYTMDNKINKYDIGGLEFVYSSAVDNYKLNVQDTLYKYLDDNSDNKRQQDLPAVKTITVTKAENVTYKLNATNVEAYQIALTWTYDEELEYDKEAVVILIKENNKMMVVEVLHSKK